MNGHTEIGNAPDSFSRPGRFDSPSTHLRNLAGILPGVLLTALIALVAFVVHAAPGMSMLSPLIIAIILGMICRNTIGAPARVRPGIAFSLRRILRLGVMLLGLQLTLGQLAAVGATGLIVIVTTVTVTFLFTLWLGRVMGVGRKLTELIAAGTSICGASAVIATNAVTDGSDEDVAYAVACVAVFGTLSMLIYPLLPGILNLDANSFGLWAGSSIHEVAQVVAAAFQFGPEAGEIATVTKLGRVLMLVPVVVGLGWLSTRHKSADREKSNNGAAPPIPWFVVGFVALVLFNSFVPIPTAILDPTVHATTFMLAMALAAMGLETDVRKLAAKGFKPLLLGAAAWLFVAVIALGLVKVLT